MSDCGLYRYDPSTADGTKDDATIRKIIGFSHRWGFSEIIVVNVFALRSRDPAALTLAADPEGPLNQMFLQHHIKHARLTVCAWGDNIRRVRPLSLPPLSLPPLGASNQVCLGRTASGNPRHPLMLAYDTPLEPFTLGLST